MVTEFERCRRTIGKREVTITSWTDGRNQTWSAWSASAPEYIHRMGGANSTPTGMASRSQAIDRMVSILTQRLETSL
jgi:hypothetical protein